MGAVAVNPYTPASHLWTAMTCSLHCPRSRALFPYTTLFRSQHFEAGDMAAWWVLHREMTLKPESSQYEDRKSTRLNSSHVAISYAVVCLKKKSTYALYVSGMLSPVLLHGRNLVAYKLTIIGM